MAAQYVSPLSLSPETRRANLAALNATMERLTARVAADTSQRPHVRAAARRDNATARRIAPELAR